MAYTTIPRKTAHYASPAVPISTGEPFSEEPTPCALIGEAVQRIDAAAGAYIDALVEDALCSIADAAADYLGEMYQGLSDFIEGRIDEYG